MLIGDSGAQGRASLGHDTLPAPRTAHAGLVGRERELGMLRAHLADAVAGRGSLVLIGGEAGVGKSALAAALAREAAEAGARVLVGHCYDRTETPPYGPWRECLARLREADSGDGAPAIAPPSFTSVPHQAALFAQVRETTAALAADRPLAILLEDLHWADTASLDLLRSLGRALASSPILLVATYRDDELRRRHPLAEIIPLLVREASADRLGLRPFDRAALDALVRARYCLPDDATTRLAEYLFDRTEGNALFATELLRALEEEHLVRRDGATWQVGDLARAPVPLLLRQVIDARLIRLGDEADALLAVAAIIGHEVPLMVWQQVTRLDEETLVTLVERAEVAHLVVPSAGDDAFRFAHALIRDVLYEGVPALRRRRLHRQIGDALAASPVPDPDAVASHYLRAGDERAVEWLTRAAERAERAFARRTAAERYEAARALLIVERGRAEEAGWLQLRAALLRRYEDAEAATLRVVETLEAAIAGQHPRLAAYARIVHGYTLASCGKFGAALRETEAGLAALPSLPPADAAQRARELPFADHLHRGPLVVWLAFVGRLAEARSQGEHLLGDVTTLPLTSDDAARQAPIWSALAYVYIMQGDLERAWRTDGIARQVHRATSPRRLVIPRIRGAFVREVLACVADDPPARDRIVAEGEEATPQGIGPQRADERANYAHYLRLPVLVVEGRWQEATDLAERLVAASTAYSVQNPRKLALCAIARARGDFMRAWQLVRAAFPEGPVTEPGEMHFSFALAMQRLAIELALDDGDLCSARAWLDAHARWLDWSGAVLGRAYAQVLRARYQHLAGMTAQAEEDARAGLAAATELQEPLTQIAARRLLAQVAAAGDCLAAARSHLDAALALADACRAPHERALTLLERAELSVAQGDAAGAAGALDEARAICEPLGARPALTRADAIAARLAQADAPALPGATRFYPTGLSAREVEVLRLVAAGLTNAQVADRLFISARTVNGHLTSIYTKLAIDGRAAAIRFAFEHGLH